MRSISDIILNSGEINIDFADAQSIMKDSGSVFMGIGSASGKNRSNIAAEDAIISPLLEQNNISNASGIIINVTVCDDFMMSELDDIMNVIKSNSPNAQIIFGLVYKDNSELEFDEEIIVTLIATGFDMEGVSNLPVDNRILNENTETQIPQDSKTDSDDSQNATETDKEVKEEEEPPKKDLDKKGNTTNLSKSKKEVNSLSKEPEIDTESTKSWDYQRFLN